MMMIKTVMVTTRDTITMTGTMTATLTGTGTMSSWDATINVSSLTAGEYLLMTRVVRSGAVVATAAPISVKLKH